jgi:hypothetical protein
MSIAEQLFEEAFNHPRSPRSPEYKAGIKAALLYRFNHKEINLPYPAGTSQCDAWFSGLDEGHAIFRNYEKRFPDGSIQDGE